MHFGAGYGGGSGKIFSMKSEEEIAQSFDEDVNRKTEYCRT